MTFLAFASAHRRSRLALHLAALSPTCTIPDWVVLDESVPTPQHVLRPGRGYLGWEVDSGLALSRAA